ncbi:MAG: nucleotidyltransferase family protein [Myxococcota bacterium]
MDGSSMDTYMALVLAGRRGTPDPLDAMQPATHPSLIDVGGVPMLLRVVRALRESERIGRIAISIDTASVLANAELAADDRLLHHQSLASPSRSVQDALSGLATGGPVLVTTADHALLTPEIISDFLERADALGTDLAVGVVEESVIRAAYPDTSRTYLRFREGGYSGANLFAFRTPLAARAAEFWVKAEQFRKRPWRLASVFGPVSLLLFVLRRLSFDAALARGSAAIGCRVDAVRLPFAEAAIDVDRPSDLALVSKILTARSQ